MKFTHLHLHTEYSLLDGTIKIPKLIEKLTETGMDSCAITDHGVMYGAYKFYKQMKNAGLKPIIGCEVYISPRDMTQKEMGVDNKYYHLVLLCKNIQGYRNLIKLVSLGHIEGFYFKPRIDFKTLEKYSEGLIALSACFSGPLTAELLKNNDKKALENAKEYKRVFKDDFYIEIQRLGFKDVLEANKKLLQIAKDLKIEIVGTTDAHYLNKEDSMIQEVLWCIADGKTIDDPSRRKYDFQEMYVKTTEEMMELYKDIPEAVENTQKIVEKIESFEITFGRVEPVYPDKIDGKNTAEYLKKLAFEGVKKRYGKLTKELEDRINFELEIINSKGYNDYFLITRSFVKFCRENGIVVGMRGSGCGSVVAYCTDITNIEPIGWELYFERFLNPERNSPPDFDVDIADRRRDEVIDFTIKKFGAQNVRQIGTFSKLQTRQAIRDVSRVLGINLQIADQLSKMVEIVFGKAKDIDYMIENNREFADLINGSPELLKMADIVRKVAGLCRGVSTHACGIVITPNPVDEYVPIQRDSKNEGIGMTQYEMFDLEEIGLMKYDFLGLRNLAVIGDALSIIEKTKGEKINLSKLDPNDKATFDLIQSGHTVGVFQLESEGMRKTIQNLKPVSQEEICYLLAAYRPGPMQFIPEYVEVKEGKKKAEYIIPDLEPILSITNGVITYQEQVIRIAVDIAGYSMGAADMLRKAMGKKLMDVMEKEKPKFIEGAVGKGFRKEDVDILWERLLQFANYGFNKAHSASYALVSYWTAYLKAHYPVEFMAALLEGDLDNFDRVVIDLQECERLGIGVLPPDINKSDSRFTIDGENNMRFGLGGIKNVGEDVVKQIVMEREVNGKYLNFDDFLYRNLSHKLQKRTVEYLIQAGTMEDFGDRNALLASVNLHYEAFKKELQDSAKGQFDLFGGTEKKIHITEQVPLEKAEEATIYQKIDWEKELLGIYLTNHPLDELQDFLQRKNAVPIVKLKDMAPSKRLLTVGGIVREIKRIMTKKGDYMAFIVVEDKTASTEMILFPLVYSELVNEMEPNKPILFAGRLNEKDDRRSFIVEKAKRIDPEKHGFNFTGITFNVKENHSIDEINDLKSFIKNNPGETQVKIVIHDADGTEKSIVLNNSVKLDNKTEEYLKKFS